MSWCMSCHRDDYDRCPFYDDIAECIYGGGCYLDKQEEEEENER